MEIQHLPSQQLHQKVLQHLCQRWPRGSSTRGDLGPENILCTSSSCLKYFIFACRNKFKQETKSTANAGQDLFVGKKYTQIRHEWATQLAETTECQVFRHLEVLYSLAGMPPGKDLVTLSLCLKKNVSLSYTAPSPRCYAAD